MNAQGHTWRKTESGQVDDFVQDSGSSEGPSHNGPGCTVCGFNFCEHCWPEGRDQECPGPAPTGFEYDWCGNGSSREPEEAQLYPVGAAG
jgi:hypothetical protein